MSYRSASAWGARCSLTQTSARVRIRSGKLSNRKKTGQEINTKMATSKELPPHSTDKGLRGNFSIFHPIRIVPCANSLSPTNTFPGSTEPLRSSRLVLPLNKGLGA